MFERRLKILFAVPVLCGIVLVVRLYELQIVRGEAYQQKAEEALVSPKQFLPPLRGRILDQFGTVLVSDEPSHDVTVHYGALKLSHSYLQRLAVNLKRSDPRWKRASSQELEREIQDRVARMWLTLRDASGISMQELRRRRERICLSIENLRQYIWNARRKKGFDEPIEKLRLREEGLFHSIIRDVAPDVRTLIEVQLSDLPFVRIEPSVRRVWSRNAEPVCHILGTLGQVTAQRIRNDPRKDESRQDNWLACYRAGDRAGVSGVELLSEEMLRGKRGYEQRDLDGAVTEFIPPIDGLDVQLTIDLELQAQIADLLAMVAGEQPSSTGASCVVIDVESREVRALVSVPTYSQREYKEDYPLLRDNAAYRPLLFRAVMEEYQPGSILKPVSLLAGFRYGLVDPARQSFCDGSYIADSPKWHCWTHWKQMPGHQYVNAEDAIKHSCNIYFFGLGELINADRLTSFYSDFIYGPAVERAQRPGTGLIEERDGLIPVRKIMRERFGRSYRRADGRNYSIGQGEMQITPLQAANIFATLAAGRYRDPTIIANDGRDRPSLEIPGVSRAAWDLVRRGVYRCVNEEGGTAFKYARLEDLEVCGKTGSAQCVARIVETEYSFESGEGDTLSAIAPTVESAREVLGLPASARCIRRKPHKRWPPNRPEKTSPPTHAWFAAFAPYRNPKIAIAAIIEHGGSGGQTTGPVVQSILQILMESPHDYLGRASSIASTGDEP